MSTAHVLERALDRYGVVLTRADMRVCRAAMRDRRAVLLDADPRNSAERWLVSVRGVVLHMVYKRAADEILTVLPPPVGRGVILLMQRLGQR